MPPKKKGERNRGFDITALTDFRPPKLSQTVVLGPPPDTPPSNSTTPPLTSASNSKNNNNNNSSLSSLPPPTLNLSENQQPVSTANNNNTNLFQQLTANTGGILYHHTTDKEYHLKHRNASSHKNHNHHHQEGRVVESERLLYVLSTYQFVISPTSLIPEVHPEMLRAMSSFDEFPPWSHICAVVQHGVQFEDFTCPICLDTPQAPRMTLCGHVFCAPCWIAHAIERENVASKKGESTSKSGGTPCPVCSKPSPVTSTKPLMFVPSYHPTKLESNKKPVEFTRLQRLRRAPVFFRPSVVTVSSTDDVVNENDDEISSNPKMQKEFTASTPLTACVPSSSTSTNNNNKSSIGQFPKTSSASFDSTSASSSSAKEYLDIIPPLCLDDADEATLSSRYVAFNANVIIEWADRQMISLSESKIQAEEQLSVIIASGDVASVEEKTNPMVLALQSQISSLQKALDQLNLEVSFASSKSVPNPMPREFGFPVGLFDAKSNPKNVVDVYRRSGPGVQLFLHPMSTRMLQEDAMERHQPLPQKISCCIEDVESITQNLEMRKHKSFSHIPLGTSYQVAFSDLRSKLLLPETAKKFDHSVEERRDKIRRMLSREAKIEKKAEEYMNYVNQVRAEREQQLLVDFGCRADTNSTSMLTEDDITKRNAEAFASALEEQQEEEQRSSKNKNTKNSGNNNNSHTNRWKPDNSWRENLPSLGDLPSSSSNQNDDINEGYYDDDGDEAFYGGRKAGGGGGKKNNNKQQNPPSTTTKSGKQIYIQSKKNIVTSPSLDPSSVATSNDNMPSLGESTTTTTTTGSNSSKWGVPLQQKQQSNNSSNSAEATVPSFSWGKPQQQQSSGKPLSFSDMISQQQQQQQQQQKKR